MAALYFCACFIVTLAEFLVVAGQPKYVLKGNQAVLSPALPNSPDDILWKHNRDKVISFDSAEEHVFPPYEGRITLGWRTAELTIADVGYEDSGEYELDAFIRDKLYRSQYMLKVLDKVSKPVIGCELSDESSNSTVRHATLLCSSDSNTPETLTFKWNLGEKSQLGQSLSITLGDEHDHIEYSCTATNPLHAETSVFMAEDCYTAERSSKTLDVIIPIVIASLILLAFCMFPFIFRHQIKRACFNRRKNHDLEKQITQTDEKNEDGSNEGSPLMGDIHRQETFASKQPLIQQNDTTATPQQQENETDMEDMPTSEPASPIRNGQVDSDRATDSFHGPESEGGSDANSHDSGQYYVVPEDQEPQSPSLSIDPQGLLPLQHVADLHNSNPNTADDPSSIRFDQEDTPEEKNSLPQPLRINEVGSDQDTESEQVEPESTERTDPDDKSESEPKDLPTDVPQNESVASEHNATGESELSSDSQRESPPLSPLQRSPASVQDDNEESSPETKSEPELKDPPTDSDRESVSSHNNDETAEDAALTDVQQKPPDSETSDQTVKSSEDSGSTVERDSITEEKPHEQDSSCDESNVAEQTIATDETSSADSEPPDSPPRSPHQSNVSASDQDSDSDTVKSGSTEQTGPDDTSTSASELTDPPIDVPQNESVTSEPNATGKSEVSSDSLTSLPHSEQPESLPPSPLQSSPASDQEEKQQISPETKSDSESNHPLTDSDHESVSSDSKDENADDVALAEKPSDTDRSARNSTSSETDQEENQIPVTNAEDSTADTKLHKQDSPGEESEESKLTSAAEKTPTGDTEMPGSVTEAAESTHQPQL